MLRINQLRLPVGHTQEELVSRIKKILHCKEQPQIEIVRRSIDARKKPELYFNYILNVTVMNQQEAYKRCDKRHVVIHEEKKYHFPVCNYQGNIRPLIIGMGPAGLFCGYMLAQAGFKPIILERGSRIDERTLEVEKFWTDGKLNEESNVQFGEGGAGTFSDGKLNTLVKDTYGRNKKVLSIFVEFGAPTEILYDYKPHIGTDILQKVISTMRNEIIRLGGEVRFHSRVTGFEVEDGRIKGVLVNEKEKIDARYVVLAPGHSARDTFSLLYEMGIHMEAKPFAIGMRVEHPQEIINLSQYGAESNDTLGNAPYKLTAKSKEGRGVYSFCMCPGGYVVDASSEPGRLAVNGMSYSKRDGKNANSAIIVAVTPKDFGDSHPLAGMEFQRMLEEKAYQVANGKIPIERYEAYKKAIQGEKEREEIKEKEGIKENKAGKVPQDFAPCVKGRWEFGAVHSILPHNLNIAFVEGMEQFGKVISGFNDANVLIEGLESRTSSPIRILRQDNLQSSIMGLYPCGEGAGYAGGITSAAMDGMKVAEAVAQAIMQE